MDHKAAFAGLQFHSSSFLQRPSGLLHCSVAEPHLQIKAFCASITVAVHSVLLGFLCFLPVFRYGVYRGQKALMRNENENLLVTHSFNYSRDKVYISHCCSQYVPMKLCYAVLFVFLSFKSITPQYSTYYEGEWKQGLLCHLLQLFCTGITQTHTHKMQIPQEVTTG